MKKKLPYNLEEISEKIKLLNSRIEKLENSNFKVNNEKSDKSQKGDKSQKYEIKLNSTSIFQLKIISVIAIALISLYWIFKVF